MNILKGLLFLGKRKRELAIDLQPRANPLAGLTGAPFAEF